MFFAIEPEKDVQRPDVEPQQKCATLKRGLLRLLAQKSYPWLTDATCVAVAEWARGKLSADNFR
jgi:hypothetical protein